MNLPDLLRAGDISAPDVPSINVTSVTADSRRACPGAVFVAIGGTRQNGAAFIDDACSKGAIAVVADAPVPAPVPVFTCANPRRALALMAAYIAGPMPDRLAAVTGTNGKTSTADFIRQIWQLQGIRAASIGTLGLIGAPEGVPAPPPLTTPDPVALSETLAVLSRVGVEGVALEASSHGLAQDRLDGLCPTVAGFSNLTRDHLDYHGTMDAYRDAKLRLFSDILPRGAVAAINADMDPETVSAVRAIAQARGHHLRTVGHAGETLRLVAATPRPHGQILDIEANGQRHEVEIPLPGRFQADNVLLAAAMAAARDKEFALDLLPCLQGVRGRMELAATLPNGAAAYVDYAHTPDALERLLSSLRPHARGRLVVVFGAGGDRDRGKRPVMGDVAARHADLAIVTDDNPRTERPEAIRAEIMAACPGAREIGDREAAIAAGLEKLSGGDVLVVAGKGHEPGQIVGTEVLPFDDRAVIRRRAGIAA
ncbi:UDP-N-acetylmuramoyl-L-alanyl-D-glutamate--2,6-diaminopimelate ligase [Tanticharoenia sakaeratensis]|uniref:UDP-N-acetylmuramoyl-L-alanyl-D-glutamate--2,6-diaminopimelate ligase n=1 Tax=Tanticharoenia sakaeratensis NBRC 103193 TaxID=1231623 RepID=A0A0D6MNZ1_9PROT|nr:UDP-N-acetylmuramoyl-L-alanyl-D-glutamate--2,6-diaminopimelate ligase [Tanticharoenia sakaeratensis]GAN55130.1 UDP-N-acetylmuramoylalanyl-D-glutamate--2, 6-diaminopimelate ligase [Tanticharoenia sakaeratensis NBRC 103193]